MALDISLFGYTLSISSVHLTNLMYSFLILLLLYISKKLLFGTLRRRAKSRRIKPYYYKPALQITNLIITLGALIAIIGVWGLQGAFYGLLAGAGFAGLVVGLAAQDTLGNFLAGLTLFSDRPFRIGDDVEVGGVRGIVKDISVRATRLKTHDGRKVVIPNSSVVGSSIINYSFYRTSRRDLLLKLPLGSDLSKKLTTISQVVSGMKEIENPKVFINRVFTSNVEVTIRYWKSKGTDTLKLETDMISRIYGKLDPVKKR